MKMIQDAVSLWSEEDGGNGCAAPAAGGGVAHASIPAENNNNVKDQDDSLDSGSTGDIRKIKLDSTDPDADHDLQPPTSEQMNICLGNMQSTSPLGLKLRTSTSFLTLLQSKISQNPSQVEAIDIHSQPVAEKIKASNFPAKILKIGSWERVSKHEGDVVAKCYYAKKKLVWEFLEKSLKRKIEIQWADILSMRAVIRVKRPGILEIELSQPPTFHHEIDPQPRKHTNWKLCADFTDGQAPICRRHYMEFAPGVLDRHYDKLLQYDSRLYELSKQPFPSLRNPYFQSITYGNASDFPLDNYCNGSQVPSHLSFNPDIFSFLNSQTNHRGPSVPTPHHHHHHHQQIPLSSLAAVDSTSPHSDDFIRGENSGHQGTAVWGQDSSYQAGYSAGNQGTPIWGQGSSNSYDYSAGDQVPGQMMIDHPSPTPSSVHYPNNNFWLDASTWLNDDRTVSDELEKKLWFGAEIGHGNMTDNRLWNVPQIRQPNITYSSVGLPQLSNGNEMTEQASYSQVTGNGTGMGLTQPLDGNAMADQANYGQVAGNDTGMGLPQPLDGNPLTDQVNYGQVAGNGTGMGLPQQLDGNAMTDQVNYGQVAGNGTGMGLLFTNLRPQEFSYLPPARVACETLPVKLPQFSGHTNEHEQGFSCSTHTQVPGEILPMQQSSDYLMHDMMCDLNFFNNIDGTINWNL